MVPLNKPTALERVNVRRLCIYVEKKVRQCFYIKKCEWQHGKIGWSELCEKVSEFAETMMEDIRIRKGVYNYEVNTFHSVQTSNIKVNFNILENSNLITIDFDLKRGVKDDEQSI